MFSGRQGWFYAWSVPVLTADAQPGECTQWQPLQCRKPLEALVWRLWTPVPSVSTLVAVVP